MECKNRDKTVDILRGLGILIMIMGHIIYVKDFRIWYHSFHMPIFYIVSGYFFNATIEDEGAFIGRKARALLLPYLFWGIFHILYNYILCGDGQALRNSVIACYVKPTAGGIPIAGALWFFPALFWINVIYFFIGRLIKNQWCLFGVSIIVGFCGMIAAQVGIHLPLAMDSALVGVAFFATGAFLHNVREKRADIGGHIFQMKWYAFVLILVVITWLIFYNDEVNFRSGVYNNCILAYVNAVVSTILLWNISGMIAAKPVRMKCFGNALASIGENSVIYVCLNEWMIACIKPAYTSVGENNVLWQIIASLMTLATVCFACHVVMKAMGQSKTLRKYVGRK